MNNWIVCKRLRAFQNQIKKILMNSLVWKYLRWQVVMMTDKRECESKSCCHFNFGRLTWRTPSALCNGPLQWWRKHETMFPILTLLGQQILSISLFHIETKIKFSLSNILTNLCTILVPNPLIILFFWFVQFDTIESSI